MIIYTVPAGTAIEIHKRDMNMWLQTFKEHMRGANATFQGEQNKHGKWQVSETCNKTQCWFQFGCSPKKPIPTGRIFMPSHARNIPQWMVLSLIIGPVYTLYLPCSIGDIPSLAGELRNTLELIGLTRCWFILSSRVVAYDDEACRWV